MASVTGADFVSTLKRTKRDELLEGFKRIGYELFVERRLL